MASYSKLGELMLKVYLAAAMTGRVESDLVKEAVYYVNYASSIGITAISPILDEGIDGTSSKNQQATHEVLNVKWKEDKKFIRECHVVIDTTGDMKSEGVTHEIGYARYCLWKPVIRVKKYNPNATVDKIEDDIVTQSTEDALIMANRLYGSYTQRLCWRLKMLNRCLPTWVWWQVKEIFN